MANKKTKELRRKEKERLQKVKESFNTESVDVNLTDVEVVTNENSLNEEKLRRLEELKERLIEAQNRITRLRTIRRNIKGEEFYVDDDIIDSNESVERLEGISNETKEIRKEFESIKEKEASNKKKLLFGVIAGAAISMTAAAAGFMGASLIGNLNIDNDDFFEYPSKEEQDQQVMDELTKDYVDESYSEEVEI